MREMSRSFFRQTAQKFRRRLSAVLPKLCRIHVHFIITDFAGKVNVFPPHPAKSRENMLFFPKNPVLAPKTKTEADQICPGSSFFGIYIRYNAPYFCRTNQFFHYAAPEKAA
ncbi:MAG: hypothetical protein ACLVF7_08260 [Ruminococcus sp.]